MSKTAIDKENKVVPEQIKQVCNSLSELLLEKNKRYGNAALQPIKIFNKTSASDSIKTRLDDKLSRVKNSDSLRKNDIMDIMGYLVLLCIAEDWLDFSDLVD